jgi:carbon storage regulator
MLVLSRKENERIRLGDSIIVTVVRVAGDKVRLGIQAPPHILVLRDELETFVASDAMDAAAIEVTVPAEPAAA